MVDVVVDEAVLCVGRHGSGHRLAPCVFLLRHVLCQPPHAHVLRCLRYGGESYLIPVSC